MVLQVPLFKLQCGVNSYEWGKTGEDSAAARFAATTPAEGFNIQSDKPYAELWMGTHPSNPSKDVQSGRTLLDLVQDNRQLLSAPVASRYGSKLPFLFKVLSINKALSIQAHPNKKLAEKLHASDPKNYPDDNHKPEMAIAITPFEGLCGFRPLAEISHFLSTVPPLKSLVKDDKADEFINTVKGDEDAESADTKARNKTALQHIFASLLSATPEEVETETKRLVDLASSEGSTFAGGGAGPSDGATLSELIVRNHAAFGSDIGLFVLFFLNYVTMEPGEAMFLRADDIHAYLKGDIIECMAASDNVVRAGFTPKFKDVTTLVDMLTYNYAPIEEQKMSPSEYPYATLNRNAYSSGSAVILYDPPIDEFSVVRSVLKGDASKATFDPLEGPSIIICTSGKGTIAVGPTVQKMSEGNVFFVGSTAEVVLQSEGDDEDEFVTFKAFCEIDEMAEEKL
ncbi:Mannose-6-phosphate isomerase [Colletotrichum orbiculare MAFF 240422]|uniref:Mannose-6-phosphate isomerase n=1 Tax=Colletotrichum orbiculare (strain 104-T / ATCC 96160 / CBS 514.97 / LARS 414 / MAFF 240422) TaxID=1213857 RepID=N4VMI2_COLOR|nr:Mannose-6-phosphate isomerase [Colletotrichum orbiculare MAFF 240422]